MWIVGEGKRDATRIDEASECRQRVKPAGGVAVSGRRSEPTGRRRLERRSGGGFVSRQTFVLDEEFFARFAPGRVERDACDRAQELALRFFKVTDTLGALVRIDLVILVAHRNGIVGAFGFADVAVDAVVGNQKGHGTSR